MDTLVILALVFLGVIAVGGMCGLIALLKIGAVSDEIRRLTLKLHHIERVLRGGAPPGPEPTGAAPLEPEPEPASTLKLVDQPFASAPAAVEAPVPAPPVPPKIARIARPPEPEPAAVAPKRDSEWWADFEERVGKRWMTWAGALVLILSVGFFVKYAIDKKWLDEVTRDVIGMAFGAALAGLGIRFARKKMTALGQGLMGGGLGILYISLYAAHAYHGWLSQPLAFGAMILVSAAGMMLSVAFDAIPISFIAILGGFLTPVMVSTGADERDILFAYLLLLDVSVLGVAFFKRWRSLDVLAFAGTAALFLMWFGKHYPGEYDLAYLRATMFWLGGFFLVFLVLPFAHHMRRKTPITVERFVMALVNATAVCTLAYYLMYRHHPHPLGYVVLGMSASYLVLGALCRRLVPEDKKSLLGFIALAVVFFTISIPLHFGLNGVTLCWAVEAPLLLYLGYVYRYRPVKLGGFAMLMVLLGRFFTRHWPLHDEPFWLFRNAPFWIAMSVVLAGAAYALVHQWRRKESLPEDRSLKVFSAVAAGFLALVFINAEIAQFFHFSFGPRELPAPAGYFTNSSNAILWSIGAVAFLACGLWARSRLARVVGLGALAIGTVAAVGLYSLDGPAAADALLNLRFGAALAVVASVFGCGVAFTCARDEIAEDGRLSATAMHVLAGFALLVLLSAENFTYAMGLHGWTITAIVWAVGAALFMAAGIRWRSAAARIAGRVALTMSILSSVVLYVSAMQTDGMSLPEGWQLFFNERFAAALTAAVVAFAYPLALLFNKSICPGRERPKVAPFFSRAAMLLLVLLTVEIFTYSRSYNAWCAVTLLWAAGAAVLLGVVSRRHVFAPMAAGVIAIGVSFFLAMRLYALAAPGGYAMFVNLRFGACLLGALLLFAAAVIARRDSGTRSLRPAINTTAAVLLFLLLSVEPYTHCVRTIADPARAAWSARMALTIVWSLYATAMLAVGFWLKSRPLRFAALALFGATGVKLVAIDLAGVRQLYRIISFLVMGVLMISASYLYHKVEKRLAAAEERPAGGAEAPPAR